jgi:hypothetical protein
MREQFAGFWRRPEARRAQPFWKGPGLQPFVRVWSLRRGTLRRLRVLRRGDAFRFTPHGPHAVMPGTETACRGALLQLGRRGTVHEA